MFFCKLHVSIFNVNDDVNINGLSIVLKLFLHSVSNYVTIHKFLSVLFLDIASCNLWVTWTFVKLNMGIYRSVFDLESISLPFSWSYLGLEISVIRLFVDLMVVWYVSIGASKYTYVHGFHLEFSLTSFSPRILVFSSFDYIEMLWSRTHRRTSVVSIWPYSSIRPASCLFKMRSLVS